MSEVAVLENDDLSDLYASYQSGPVLSQVTLNKPGILPTGNVVPLGVKVTGTTHGDVYGSKVRFRIYMDRMQTSVYDEDTQNYSNMSMYFSTYKGVTLDWYGGDKCGWITSKEREALKVVDPIAYAVARKVKLSRTLFGTISVDDAVNDAGESVVVEDVVCRMKLGPSNFFEISGVIGKMVAQDCLPIMYDVQFNFRMEKKGSNEFVVLSYTPLLTKRHELTVETVEIKNNFLDLIRVDNDKVLTRMRANVGNDTDSEVLDQFDPDVIVNEMDDEIPF
tara:strand:+ start:4777 stop:5610 length:834 start_codon:yes stop_codon:yes gene_type:complete